MKKEGNSASQRQARLNNTDLVSDDEVATEVEEIPDVVVCIHSLYQLAPVE